MLKVEFKELLKYPGKRKIKLCFAFSPGSPPANDECVRKQDVEIEQKR